MIDVVYPNCAGLDVHKKCVTVCRLTVDGAGTLQQELRTFSTMTRALEGLAAWLAEGGCTHVAMESTGVYWQPLYNMLEGQFTVVLVNAQAIKRMPGRKTDVKDAEWLATVLQHGLVQGSFIPSREQRELRDLVRYRQSVVDERSRVVNRLQKVLEDANLKLASVVTDLHGVSAQAILRAVVAGEVKPQVLAELARGRLRAKRAELEQALVGQLREHHRFVLAELLTHLDELDEAIARLEARIEAGLGQLPGYEEAVRLLDTIPGVDRVLAILIVAEIGIDMSRFPSDRHLTAWAGVAPGNNESGGKQRSGKTRKGNRALRRGVTLAAHGAAHSQQTYLRALYYRLAARRGTSRAALAVGRTILQIAYHLIQRGETYHELGADYFDRRDVERTTKRLVHRLEALGFEVALTARPAEAAA